MGPGGGFVKDNYAFHTSRAYRACLCQFVLALEKMAALKKALVQFNENSRCVDVPNASSLQSERELLIERIKDVYNDLLSPNCTIFLQKKDEEWGGAFVDYFESAVPDRSVFRIVIAKPVKVYFSIALTRNVVIDPYCVLLLTG